MPLLIRLILLLIPIAIMVVGTSGWLALSDSPWEFAAKELTHEDIARAKLILRRYDPRRSRAGHTRYIELTEQDLNLAVNYALKTYASGGARIDLQQDEAIVKASARLPHLPVRPYVNMRGKVLTTAHGPQIVDLNIGRLSVPNLLADWMVKQATATILSSADVKIAKNTLQRLHIGRSRVALRYRWDPKLVDAVRDNIISMRNQGALDAYHATLVELTRKGIGTAGSLADFLPHIARLASQRSQAGQAIEENRAMLLVLGAWAGGYGLRTFVPEANKRPTRFRLKLHGRRDFAQHYLVSAALAVGGDGLLADAIGLFKEVSDSKKSSGFSFSDLAADRAGTRFGERAISTETDAHKLQQALAKNLDDVDLMPAANDLPENLSTIEFSKRYTAVGSPAYRALMTEIERRVESTPILRR